MGVCNLSKFILTKNVDNEFFFVIKENRKTTPMEIKPTDEFILRLIRLEDNNSVDLTKNLEVVDSLNGKLRFYISAGGVNDLLSERGPKEDRYYAKAVYSLIIEANTTINGVFVARIGKVYVR